MKILKSIIAVSVVAFTASVAHAQGPQKSLEERAVEFRHSVFETLSWKMGQLAGAKQSGNQSEFTKHAKDLSYISGLILEGFIPNSLIEGSKAKSAVWEDREGFTKAAEKLQTMAAELADPGYDMAAFDPRNFGRQACGNCHKDYKERD